MLDEITHPPSYGGLPLDDVPQALGEWHGQVHVCLAGHPAAARQRSSSWSIR